MTEILKTKEEMEEFLNNLGIEYRYSCYEEKNGEGCHLLGQFLQVVRDEYKKAYGAFWLACTEYNYPKSCNEIGILSFQGKGTKANKKEALKYFEMACQGGNAEGCFHAGQMKMGTDEDVVKGGVKPNVKEGIAQLEKACKLGLPDGCFDASCHYLQGTQGLEKDEKKAFSYAKRACEDLEPMHMESCNNLMIMHKRGIGTKKDKEAAKSVQEKIDDYIETLKKARNLGLQAGTE